MLYFCAVTNCSGHCEGCLLASKKDIRVKVFTCSQETVPDLFGGRQSILCQGHCIHLTQDDDFDVALSVIDSLNLERDLFATTKLIDKDLRIVGVLMRYGELLATDHALDYDTLGELFGCRIAPLSGAIDHMIVEASEGKDRSYRHTHITYGQDLDEAIAAISSKIAQVPLLASKFHDRYLALGLLGGEIPQVDAPALKEEARIWAARLERSYGQDVFTLVHNARLGFVAGALQETLRHSKGDKDFTAWERLDKVLTNRYLGFPILILVLLGIFEATFYIGSWPQGWIDSGVDLLAQWLKTVMAPGWVTSLLTDGIVCGVGAVLSFLPNIILLFFFLSLLEDSGFMARAAFLMDKIMHNVGLHGRSFVPMLIGFGCNVPAIMAARSIEDKRDRTLTMLMIPFMSCSARLPVYMLFVSAFFARHKALVMLSLYLLGILLSILFALLMKRSRYFRKENDDYVSELPPFRTPTLRNTGAHICSRAAEYLKKISTVILWASIIIWALGYFPGGKSIQEAYQTGQQTEQSYLEQVGKWVSPALEPLGFDWKMSVCILTGLPAKEAIVSTMGILYRADADASEGSEGSLVSILGSQEGFTPALALSFMVFVLLYFPCVATVASLRREIGLRWAAFTVVHSLLLAWVMAFVVFHLFS